MRLFLYALGQSKKLVLLAVLASVLSGGLSLFLIAAMNNAAQRSSSSYQGRLTVFLSAVAANLIMSYIAQVLLTKISIRSTVSIRSNLASQILETSLRNLEEIGEARLIGVLTHNITEISQAIISIPGICTSISMLVCSFGYLLWLDNQIFALVLVFCVIGIPGFLYIQKHSSRAWHITFEERNRVFKCVNAMVTGIKELKVHSGRRQDFLTGELQDSDNNWAVSHGNATNLQNLETIYTQGATNILISVVLFILPIVSGIDGAATIAAVMTVLFVLGPLHGAIVLLPNFRRAEIVLKQLREFQLTLGPRSNVESKVGNPFAGRGACSIELCSVRYQYYDKEHKKNFCLGPLNCRFSVNEVVFITGGNGSGKTTLAKVLSGLYVPDEGKIVVDELVVTKDLAHCYRELFSVVFSNPIVFEKALGLSFPALHHQATQLIEEMGLKDRISIEHDGSIISRGLSQGQKKRLALVLARLENRPFYVLDEWAADQDPSSKAYFYTKLISEFKAMGKGVIIITHDDSFFRYGDRVIKLEQGMIVWERPGSDFV